MIKSETFFLHGYESSGKGTKGKFLTHHFPFIHCPDFEGTLENRLDQLNDICGTKQTLTFIGSSFGGLMATCHSLKRPKQVTRLILLAPALNFENYQPPQKKLEIPTLLIIGKNDTVTPASLVIPLAKSTFNHLDIHIVNDDHMLHNTFHQLHWKSILSNIS